MRVMTSQYEISGKTHICIVILTLICIFICCAFAGDSYQESKPGNKKRKSEVSVSYRVSKHRRKPSHSRTRKKTAYNYSDPGGTLEKIKQPKTLI